MSRLWDKLMSWNQAPMERRALPSSMFHHSQPLFFISSFLTPNTTHISPFEILSLLQIIAQTISVRPKSLRSFISPKLFIHPV